MPAKIARSTPRPSFGLPELLVAIHISRQASNDAAKSLPSTLVSESSGECRRITSRIGRLGRQVVCAYRRSEYGTFDWSAKYRKSRPAQRYLQFGYDLHTHRSEA